ncbi:7022_t:CDS:2 [Paraglomus occultum]|uniref:7022_t:CDS:1 n=1 Tax=Paraglomus occultum TaxID=144539 RepID=A0A9N9F6W3_9GLOM|nr:7022_t:CDS:2 [Paraglomus occultum]
MLLNKRSFTIFHLPKIERDLTNTGRNRILRTFNQLVLDRAGSNSRQPDTTRKLDKKTTKRELTGGKELAVLTAFVNRMRQRPLLDDKIRTIRDFNRRPRTGRVFKLIYDPSVKFYLTPKRVHGLLSTKKVKAKLKTAHEFKSLMTLLNALSNREITGREALLATGKFIQKYCVTPEKRDLFFRILDKDLDIGMTAEAVNKLWEDTPQTRQYYYSKTVSNPAIDKESTSICSATQQFDTLAAFVEEIKATNTFAEKYKILSAHPECHSLLNKIYDPTEKFNITSKNLIKYMQNKPRGYFDSDPTNLPKQLQNAPVYDNIESLLSALSERQISGQLARFAVARFVHMNCTKPIHKELMYKILCKNLKIGMNIQRIKKVCGVDSIATFSVALGRTLKMNQIDSLFASSNEEDSNKWFASRKLDGVRCLVVARGMNVRAYSRSGKSFVTLKKIIECVKQIIRKHRKVLYRKFWNEGLVLDGELCVISEGIDGQFRETFADAMAVVGTANQQVEDPTYCVFDCLSKGEFERRVGERTFAERLEFMKMLIENPIEKKERVGLLDQIEVNNGEHLRNLISQASSAGWEGLILRKNVGYEGKRSCNMLKIKQHREAEYQVKAIETGPMNIYVNGKVEERDVLTNVLVEHAGNKVSVGSGFTVEQRIKYKERPDLIIGKEITVQYFDETEVSDKKSRSSRKRTKTARDDKVSIENTTAGVVRSLRFPTVKAVWENGKRDV